MYDAVVLYDGECGVCNRAVNFVIDRDPKGKVAFASLQSLVGKNYLEKFHLKEDLSTMVLVEGEKCYTKSSAVLRTMLYLTFPWFLLYVLIIIPWFIRDWGYAGFAKIRTKIPLKKSCRIPSQEILSRFIEDI
eukprot:TRINITY_DN14693_c0_g1_i1.p1 TRINITY_DN14693_c0_g1~~TRINITY_DN14693_c0_g1_i1.p1  ORF type:complete len:133 (+),score=17.72 TRINITY_DN14693_c0_g1_i1:40-438(+)